MEVRILVFGPLWAQLYFGDYFWRSIFRIYATQSKDRLTIQWYIDINSSETWKISRRIKPLKKDK